MGGLKPVTLPSLLSRTRAVGIFPLPTVVAVTASEPETGMERKAGGPDRKTIEASGTGGRAGYSRVSVSAPCSAIEAQHHLYL